MSDSLSSILGSVGALCKISDVTIFKKLLLQFLFHSISIKLLMGSMVIRGDI